MSTALTLYNLEENLVALLDTADIVEDPAQQEAIFQEIVVAHLAAVEKRDKVAQFIAHCENQQSGIDAEIKRLQALKQTYSKTQDRVEEYVVRTIQGVGVDEKGKYRKLEGRACVFSLRARPASVEVKDDAAIPAAFKTVTVTVPQAAWQDFTDNLDIDERSKLMAAVRRTEVAIDKRAVKAAIDGGAPVAGADLSIGQYSLVRK